MVSVRSYYRGHLGLLLPQPLEPLLPRWWWLVVTTKLNAHDCHLKLKTNVRLARESNLFELDKLLVLVLGVAVTCQHRGNHTLFLFVFFSCSFVFIHVFVFVILYICGYVFIYICRQAHCPPPLNATCYSNQPPRQPPNASNRDSSQPELGNQKTNFCPTAGLCQCNAK